MAEFMIRIEDRITGDPMVDASNWKTGDVVGIYEDGRCIEPPAPTVPMWVIKIPGLTLLQVNKFIEEHTDANGQLILRRKCKIDLSKIPSKLLDILVTTKWITITKTVDLQSIENAMYNKLTDTYGL